MNLKKIKSHKYFELYIDEEESIYSWKLLPASEEMTFEDLKECVNGIMSLLKKYSPKIVLGDDRENLATFGVEIQEWIATVTLDSLKSSKTEKFAIIRPKELINQLATEQAIDELRKLTEGTEIKIFSDEESALNWISI